MTPRTEALQFYASWGSSGDGGHVIHAEDAEELETRVLSAEADNTTTKSILQTVAATSVEQLRNRYMDLLKRSNEKDMPFGFDSWENYHKHVSKTYADNARLRSVLERFVKWDKDYPKGTIYTMNGEKALDALFVEAAAILSKP